MTRPFTEADLPFALECWNSFYSAKYSITPQLLKRATVGSKLFLPNQSTAWEGGFIAFKASAPGHLFPGDKLATAHIGACAATDANELKAVLSNAIPGLKQDGFNRLVFGGDGDHLFPGCPDECTDLQAVLESAGFTKPDSFEVDVERDLVDYEPTGAIPPGIRICTPDDHSLLNEFLARAFPGRWHHDVMLQFEEEPTRVAGAFVGGRCEGFALLEHWTSHNRIGGAMWYLDLGKNWGSLGPIGVSTNVRGQGYGNGLLTFGLTHLQSIGVRRTIIDWTTLIDFYGKHGFEVARKYWAYSREI